MKPSPSKPEGSCGSMIVEVWVCGCVGEQRRWPGSAADGEREPVSLRRRVDGETVRGEGVVRNLRMGWTAAEDSVMTSSNEHYPRTGTFDYA